jgi:hypothetical protein
MIHMNSMDSIVVGRLRDLYETLAINNISMAIARPRPTTLKYLIRGGFVSLIGQDFAVDSISSCVIRCNAVLRAAMRFQAFKLMENEENEERAAQQALQASLNASVAAISSAAIRSMCSSKLNPKPTINDSKNLKSSQNGLNASETTGAADQASQRSESVSYNPKADENVLGGLA